MTKKQKKIYNVFFSADLIEVLIGMDCYEARVKEIDSVIVLQDKDNYFPPVKFTLNQLEEAAVEANKLKVNNIRVEFFKLSPKKI